jgi:uncharacterized protein (DUF2062 family)
VKKIRSVSDFSKISRIIYSSVISRIFHPLSTIDSPGLNIKQKFRNMVVKELSANTSSFKASASLSTGVFMAIMPIHGFQVVSLLILTFILRLNRPLALLGVTVSSAPFLPFWIISGLGVGKLFIPQSTADIISTICKNILPSQLISFIETSSTIDFFQGFIQWFLGSIILAVMCGIIVFITSYPLFQSVKSLYCLSKNRKKIKTDSNSFFQ